jgi:hypothetical protein
MSLQIFVFMIPPSCVAAVPGEVPAMNWNPVTSGGDQDCVDVLIGDIHDIMKCETFGDPNEEATLVNVTVFTVSPA